MADYQMELYTTSVLSATLDPPVAPTSQWRQEWIEAMDELADISCKAYRKVG